MKDKIMTFLSRCAKTDFGRITLSGAEEAFYRRFNAEVLFLCRSLPDSVRTESLLFLLQYSGLNLRNELNFFANYYPPSWSILYWLTRNGFCPARRSRKADVTNAIEAQSMAMLLHSLDDHLNDSQLSVSHLSLLLRSQAWMIMNRAFLSLAEDVPGGERVVRRFIAEYYSSIQDTKGMDSIDGYCELFRRQMGIGMIAPTLLSMKRTGSSGFTRDLQTAYGSFGIAWRLLDDIKDLGDDIKNGAQSVIYVCLPQKARTRWNLPNATNRTRPSHFTGAILDHIVERGLVETIKDRICAELETAASTVEAYGLAGLAREFRCLARPLTKCTST